MKRNEILQTVYSMAFTYLDGEDYYRNFIVDLNEKLYQANL